jgi:ribosomal protein S17
MFFSSRGLLSWHYKYWQRQTAGWLRVFARNKEPLNEMVGYVINDKHPKTIRVACDRYMYVMRYKKSFRYTKKVWAHDENGDARLGDVVRVQPLGYRLGPMKTYVLKDIVHKEVREGTLRGSDARLLSLMVSKKSSS